MQHPIYSLTSTHSQESRWLHRSQRDIEIFQRERQSFANRFDVCFFPRPAIVKPLDALFCRQEKKLFRLALGENLFRNFARGKIITNEFNIDSHVAIASESDN